MKRTTAGLINLGSELRWLERTPDKRKVGGSSPLEPTMESQSFQNRKFACELRDLDASPCHMFLEN